MTTQIDHLQAGRAPQTIRLGPAAAIGLALLVLGLAIGLVAGRLQQGAADQAVSAPQATAKPPALTWRDDYGTRHPLVQAKTPVLTWRDDYGTRHPEARL
jgi:F0F1-type ATP synthase membrane subunit c/vacuolar-type H+-ATPase subunit K